MNHESLDTQRPEGLDLTAQQAIGALRTLDFDTLEKLIEARPALAKEPKMIEMAQMHVLNRIAMNDFSDNSVIPRLLHLFPAIADSPKTLEKTIQMVTNFISQVRHGQISEIFKVFPKAAERVEVHMAMVKTIQSPTLRDGDINELIGTLPLIYRRSVLVQARFSKERIEKILK